MAARTGIWLRCRARATWISVTSKAFDAIAAVVLSIGPGRLAHVPDGGWRDNVARVLQNTDPAGSSIAWHLTGGWLDAGRSGRGPLPGLRTPGTAGAVGHSGGGRRRTCDEAAFAASGTCIAQAAGELVVVTGGGAARLLSVHADRRLDGGWTPACRPACRRPASFRRPRPAAACCWWAAISSGEPARRGCARGVPGRSARPPGARGRAPAARVSLGRGVPAAPAPVCICGGPVRRRCAGWTPAGSRSSTPATTPSTSPATSAGPAVTVAASPASRSAGLSPRAALVAWASAVGDVGRNRGGLRACVACSKA